MQVNPTIISEISQFFKAHDVFKGVTFLRPGPQNCPPVVFEDPSIGLKTFYGVVHVNSSVSSHYRMFILSFRSGPNLLEMNLSAVLSKTGELCKDFYNQKYETISDSSIPDDVKSTYLTLWTSEANLLLKSLMFDIRR